MNRERKVLATAAAALLIGLGTTLLAGARDPGKLGKVHFPVSCNAAAQTEFDVTMAYYHSFAWPQMKVAFERTVTADPSCGMAHWARALASLNNPFLWPGSLSPKTLDEGQAALDAAQAVGLKTQRERDYVDALAAFYKDRDKLDHRTRAKALESALERVASRYPEDTEATILHALVLSANFDPSDKKYTNQLRAARLLEPIFAKNPEHPGVAHYLATTTRRSPSRASRRRDATRGSRPTPRTLTTCPHTSSRGSATGASRSSRTAPRRASTRIAR
jgi:hypothetical protein